jgi:hypothetical protein
MAYLLYTFLRDDVIGKNGELSQTFLVVFAVFLAKMHFCILRRRYWYRLGDQGLAWQHASHASAKFFGCGTKTNRLQQPDFHTGRLGI